CCSLKFEARLTSVVEKQPTAKYIDTETTPCICLRFGGRWAPKLGAALWSSSAHSRTLERVHVLSVSSLKGGVGKTTVALGLASASFSRGLRTLVVDLDPQSDASTGLDADPEGFGNIADVLEDTREKTVRSAI